MMVMGIGEGLMAEGVLFSRKDCAISRGGYILNVDFDGHSDCLDEGLCWTQDNHQPSRWLCKKTRSTGGLFSSQVVQEVAQCLHMQHRLIFLERDNCTGRFVDSSRGGACIDTSDLGSWMRTPHPRPFRPLLGRCMGQGSIGRAQTIASCHRQSSTVKLRYSSTSKSLDWNSSGLPPYAKIN